MTILGPETDNGDSKLNGKKPKCVQESLLFCGGADYREIHFVGDAEVDLRQGIQCKHELFLGGALWRNFLDSFSRMELYNLASSASKPRSDAGARPSSPLSAFTPTALSPVSKTPASASKSPFSARGQTQQYVEINILGDLSHIDCATAVLRVIGPHEFEVRLGGGQIGGDLVHRRASCGMQAVIGNTGFVVRMLPIAPCRKSP